MKRFTETGKWTDPWYRRLSSPAKQLWEYLRDQCNSVGIVEIDLELISADCGQKITQSNLSELGDRIQVVSEKKVFLPKFINFQYGELSPDCPPHRSILKLVELHNLVRVGLHYRYPNATLSLGYDSCQVVDNQQKGSYPNARVATTLQDKEKEPVQEKDKGGTGGRFKKPGLEEVRLYFEKSGVPNSEAEKFFNYYESNGWRVGKNPMRSWHGAASNWKKNFEERRFEQSGKAKPAESKTFWDRELDAYDRARARGNV